MEIRDKRGSHVSLILSFIIFVVSLIFVYVIASAAITVEKSKKGDLFTIEDNLLDKLKSDVWVFRINTEAHSSELPGNKVVAIDLPELISGGNSAVANEFGHVPSRIEGNQVIFDGADSGLSFTKVYYSDLIENDDHFTRSNIVLLSPDSTSKEKIILPLKIENIMGNFSSNYALLKEELGVPDDTEYNLYFEYENGTSIGTLGPDPQTDIYVREVKINYLDYGGYETGKFVIKIW